MDHRLIQPASRDQIVAIIRQRAERANRDLPAHLGQALFPAPAFIDSPARERAREMEPGAEFRDAREGNRAGAAYRRRAEEEVKPRTERISVVGSSLQYQGDRGLPGLYISGTPLSPDRAYFEAEITAVEGGGGPVVGLCSHRFYQQNVCRANLCLGIHWTCYQAGLLKVWVTIQGMASFTKADPEANPLVPGDLAWLDNTNLGEEDSASFLLQVSSRGSYWLWGQV